MRFVVTLPEDGRRISGDIHIPGAVPYGSPDRAAALARLEKMLRDRRQPAAPIRQRIANLVPGLAAQLEPELRSVGTPAGGKATPPPAIRAREIAKRLAIYVAGEQLVRDLVLADFNRAKETAGRLEKRMADLEGRP